MKIKMFSGEKIPLEMHKVRIVQKLNLIPIEERKKAIEEAGFNTFLLRNKDVFLDMLTDSGVNAMSDNQLAAMMIADDSYAGSETYYRFEKKVIEILTLPYVLPAHQGRACENIINQTFVKKGDIVPMNFHFTTSKSHVTINGGSVIELLTEEGLKVNSDHPFKGNIDLVKLESFFKTNGTSNVPYVRIEAGTNLIGGQPLSLDNFKQAVALCNKYKVKTVLDASLLQDNLYFIKVRDASAKNKTIKEITKEICSIFDIIYFSARKFGFAKGGAICVKDEKDYLKMKGLIPLYEGFLTYGGMSVKEIEAITVGLDETMDMDVISQGPLFIEYMVDELLKAGVPVVTPAGGLGCHVNAKAFLSHLDSKDYPAGALATALYLVSGVRGMERGTMSEQRNPDGTEIYAEMELVRLAMPRRVFTLSQVKYAIDRIVWLYQNKELVGGLEFYDEPEILRFFFGKLKPTSNWPEKLLKKFREDFGDSL